MRAPFQLDLHVPNFNWPDTSPEAFFEKLVEIAKTAEDSGFSSISMMDHLHQIPPVGTQDRFMFVVNRMQAKAGKPETTEREYLLDRLATPAGVKIAEAARKTVDERRALEDDVEGLI